MTSVAELVALWDRIGDRRSLSCCDCDAMVLGARGEPEVHLRARAVAVGWTVEVVPARREGERLYADRLWCPRHRPRPPTAAAAVVPNVSISTPGSPYVRGAPLA